MREISLKSVDLNLLVILCVLLEQRHVSRAAQLLNMSQPAVSRALQRLRDTFDDPLLVRTRTGYDLSARATALQPQLTLLLGGVEQLIAPPQFDPARANNLIRVTGLDLDVSLYLPPLVLQARQQAPGMRFEVVVQQAEHFSALDRGDVQFCLTALEPESGGDQLHRMEVDSMSAVCLMDARNPLAAEALTLARYVEANHGLVSITGRGPGVMDELLAQLGHARKVQVRLASFMSVADFCEGSDLIFTLPERLADSIVRRGGISNCNSLTVRPLPVELQQLGRPVVFYLYWHQRYHQQPACVWLREQMQWLKEQGRLIPGP
ncbi:MAG: LysR family transcriptional regulator [Marinobacterium sp.]|nr:LysR family transcriptional regulator [Marinobacterium sp.]